MRKFILQIFGRFIILLIPFFLFSCATSTKTVEIFKPQELYRSPALDFTKVSVCGIMPINNIGSEYPTITYSLGQNLYNDLKSMQKAWNIISDEDLLRDINEGGLGRGYQNYIADLNTFSTVGGATPLFTAETQEFFKELRAQYNIDALLFTSYNYYERQLTSDSQSIIFKMLEESTERHIEVYTALYNIETKRVWWVCRQGLKSGTNIPMEELVASATKSIGQNFGKGTLRQL